MGSKYKKALERKWKGKTLYGIKLETIKIKTDRNLSNVIKGKYKRRSKK
jgi:hypothetical protein